MNRKWHISTYRNTCFPEITRNGFIHPYMYMNWCMGKLEDGKYTQLTMYDQRK